MAVSQTFEQLEETFNDAMVSNDADRISACVAEDWSLITPEVGPVSRERILEVISNGTLTHDTMTKVIVRWKIYGDIALVTSRGQNSGTFQGTPITADEWITNVYRNDGDRWLCVLTHLTPACSQ